MNPKRVPPKMTASTSGLKPASWASRHVLLAAVIVLVVLGSWVGIASGSANSRHLGTPGAAASTFVPSTLGAWTLAGAQASLAHPTPLQPHPASTAFNATGPAVSGWTNISGSISSLPPPRSYGRMMEWDPADGYVLLFGGDGTSGYMSDTWTFKGGHWTQLHPKTAPSDRDHGTLAWDGADGYMLLFGGSGTTGTYTDTWKFAGGNWTQLSPTSAPSGRWASQMVYDGTDGYVLLFGGCAGYAVNDTWSFKGGNWTQHVLTHAPPKTSDANLVYDARDGYVVLYGGQIDPGATVSNQTWVYQGGSWTQLHPPAAPVGRYEASMTYDPVRGQVVLFGGIAQAYSNLADTWAFSNGFWTSLSPLNPPPGRGFGMLSNDTVDGYLVLYGGYGGLGYTEDTWAFYSLAATLGASASAGEAPFNVSFSASATGGIGGLSYAWTVGSLNTVYGTTLNYSFTAGGYYPVTLVVTDSLGLTATVTRAVQVVSPLAAIGSASPDTGVAPLKVALTAVAIGGVAPYSVAWAVNGQGIASTLLANTTLSTPGTYTVSLTVVDADSVQKGWTTQVLVTAAVPAPLFASAQGFPLRGDVPLSVSFTGQAFGGVAPLSYSWSFADGGTGTTAGISHVFLVSGELSANLTVTDPAGLRATATVLVHVSPMLTVQVPGDTPTTAKVGKSLAFQGTASGGLGPYVYTWDFGDGSTAGAASTTHVFGAAGTHPVTLSAYDANSGTAQTTFNVSVAAVLVTPPPTQTAGGGSSGPNPMWVGLGAGLAIGIVATGAIAFLIRWSRWSNRDRPPGE